MDRLERNATYKFLVLTAIAYTDVRLASFVENLEEEVLDIRLNLNTIVFATNKSLCIKDAR